MIRFPYRWSIHTALKNIAFAAWDIRSGVKNVWRFRKAVWWFRSFDYAGLLEFMEVSAREMRRAQLRHPVHSRAMKCAKELTILAEVCRRLREENYLENSGWDSNLPEFQRVKLSMHICAMEKQDAEYLGRVMRRIQFWWT